MRSGREPMRIGNIETGDDKLIAGMNKLVAGFEANDERQGALSLSRADAHYAMGLSELNRSLENDPDYETHGERFEAGAARLRAEADAMIPDPRVRERWGPRADMTAYRSYDGVVRRANRLRTDSQFADLETDLGRIYGAYTQAPDDDHRHILRTHIEETIALGVRQGLIPPNRVARIQSQYLGGLPEADAQAFAEANPWAWLQGRDERAGQPSTGQVSEHGLALLQRMGPQPTGRQTPAEQAAAQKRVREEAAGISAYITENVTVPMTQLQHDGLVAFAVRRGRDALTEALPLINAAGPDGNTDWSTVREVVRRGGMTAMEQPSGAPAGATPERRSDTGTGTVTVASGEDLGQIIPIQRGPLLRSDRGDGVAGLSPAYVSSFARMLNDMPPETRDQIEIASAHRSTAHQAELYARHRAGGPLAAPPGRSRHEHGEAIDLAPRGGYPNDGPAYRRALDWIYANSERYGIVNPAGIRGRDPGHFELMPNARAAAAEPVEVALGGGHQGPAVAAGGPQRYAQRGDIRNDASPAGGQPRTPEPETDRHIEAIGDMLVGETPPSRFQGLDPARARAITTHVRNSLINHTTQETNDDLARIRRTGEPAVGPDGRTSFDRAALVFLPNQRARLAIARQEAERSFRATAGLNLMTEDQMERHLNDLSPTNIEEDESYAVATRVENVARRAADRIREIRQRDPALAVSGGIVRGSGTRTQIGADGSLTTLPGDDDMRAQPAPEVAQAMEVLRRRHPEIAISVAEDGSVAFDERAVPDNVRQDAWRVLIDARLTAQDRLGIQRAPITRAEATRLLNMPADANLDDTQFERALRGAADRAAAIYGPTYGRLAFETALGFRTTTRERRDSAASVISSLVHGDQMTQADFDRLRRLQQLDQETAMWGGGGRGGYGAPTHRFGMDNSLGAAGNRANFFNRNVGITGEGFDVPLSNVGQPDMGRPAISTHATDLATGSRGGFGAGPIPRGAQRQFENPLPEEVEWLRRNPTLWQEFDRDFGPGAAATYLQGDEAPRRGGRGSQAEPPARSEPAAAPRTESAPAAPQQPRYPVVTRLPATGNDGDRVIMNGDVYLYQDGQWH